jgi:hypothetical protein
MYAMNTPGIKNAGAMATIVIKERSIDTMTVNVLEKEVAIDVSMVSKSFESRFRIRPESGSSRSVERSREDGKIGKTDLSELCRTIA